MSFEVKKGVPFKAPVVIEEEIIASGGECLDGAVVLTDDVPDVVPVVEETTRIDTIHKAFKDILLRNDAKDFTAQGTPSLVVMKRRTGLVDLDRGEVDEFWTAYRQNGA
jgi:hypothetical protein